MKIKSSQHTNGVLFAKNTRPDIKEITAKKNEYLRELEQKKAEAEKQENLFAERRQKWLQEKRNEAELKTIRKPRRHCFFAKKAVSPESIKLFPALMLHAGQ
jgi:hypothetical protein